jgi:hypothetical protein
MEHTASDSAHKRPRRAARLPARAAIAAAAACLLAPGAGSAGAQGDALVPTPPAATSVTATLEQCLTSALQSERSATFTGEMTAIAGTAKMSMRIDLEERGPEDVEFHTVGAEGVGAWRSSEPKVKIYKYVRQVTNLSSPAAYRALVRFRWIGAKGRVIRRAERLTTGCVQPATAPQPTPPGATTPAGVPPVSSGAAVGAPSA